MTDVVIGRVRVELHCRPRGSARAWQQRVSRWVEEELPSRLLAALAGLPTADATGGGRDDHWLLPAVEIDVGRISGQRLESELGQRLEAALRGRCDRELTGRQVARAPGVDPQRAGGSGTDTEQEADAARLIPGHLRELQLLAQFLRSGALPWWSPSNWRCAVALETLLRDQSDNLAGLLRQLAADVRCRRRLALHLPDHLAPGLLALVAPPLDRAMLVWRELPGRAEQPGQVGAVFDFLLGEWLAQRLPDATALSAETLLAALLRHLDAAGHWPVAGRVAGDRQRLPADWATAWRQGLAGAKAAPGWRDAGRDGPPVAGTGHPDRREATAAQALATDAGAGASPAAGTARAGQAGIPAAPVIGERAPGAAPPPSAGIALNPAGIESLLQADTPLVREVEVPQAGVVLLAPYLPLLFSRLGLRRDGEFVDGGRERAVHLLHFAASGESGAEEHQLALPKLLCGWPAGQPLAPVPVPTQLEIEELDDLLRSVIEHWTALGRTSTDGLRDAFLRRPGRLVYDRPPVLRVERRAYDMLLERLPQPISLIRLSWMEDVLRTEW